jgi:hypothetical protein
MDREERLLEDGKQRGFTVPCWLLLLKGDFNLQRYTQIISR